MMTAGPGNGACGGGELSRARLLAGDTDRRGGGERDRRRGGGERDRRRGDAPSSARLGPSM